MDTRTLGARGDAVGVISLGTRAIAGAGWRMSMGAQDDDVSIRTIHAALHEGITLIDVAPVYGLGHAEVVVGKALQGRRDDAFVATKCVRRVGPDGPYTSGDPAGIRHDCETSLQRLQTDHLDLLQIHHSPPDVEIEESWSTLVALRNEGKTRFIGLSNCNVELTQRCLAVAHVDSTQPEYNLLRRGIEDDLLPLCASNGIGVLPYWPIAEGLLSGSFDPSRLAADDSRRRADFEAATPDALRVVDRLRPLAAERGLTVGQLCIAWVAAHPAVTSVIVGARTPAQATVNAAAAIQAGDPTLRTAVDAALCA